MEIKITQKLIKTGDASYQIRMEVDSANDIEIIEFNYEKTNAIYPLYRSLIEVLKQYENVHIKLKTSSEVFVREVKGIPNKNTRLLEILKEIKERQNITIDAE